MTNLTLTISFQKSYHWIIKLVRNNEGFNIARLFDTFNGEMNIYKVNNVRVAHEDNQSNGVLNSNSSQYLIFFQPFIFIIIALTSINERFQGKRRAPKKRRKILSLKNLDFRVAILYEKCSQTVLKHFRVIAYYVTNVICLHLCKIA